MTETHLTGRQSTTSSARQLVIGLVCVLAIVGTVYTIQSLRRSHWEADCVHAGGQVVVQSGERDPYLAAGSTIGRTCVDPAGTVVGSWP